MAGLNDKHMLGRGGHLGLIVMHLFKAYARSRTTDIDRYDYEIFIDKQVIQSVHVHEGLQRTANEYAEERRSIKT